MASNINSKNGFENNNKNVHAGHRGRMRDRFTASKETISDHELLEMLLYYVNSRVNTNDIAHNLLNEFGTLKDVCNAPPDMLMQVKGVGENTAIFFSLLFEMRKRIQMQKYFSKKFNASSLTKVGEMLSDHYSGMCNEQITALLLDGSLNLIEFSVVSNGSANSSGFDIRRFARYALGKNALYVILAHNHPTGSCDASAADKDMTARIEVALSAIDIYLLEHIIVSETSYRPTMLYRTAGGGFSMSGNTPPLDILNKFYNS